MDCPLCQVKLTVCYQAIECHQRITPVFFPSTQPAKKLEPVLPDLPGNVGEKRVPAQLCSQAVELEFFPIVDSGSVFRRSGSVNGAAVGTAPPFHPQPFVVIEEAAQNETVSPQPAGAAGGTGSWFFPWKFFSQLLNIFQIYPTKKYQVFPSGGVMEGAVACGNGHGSFF